MPPCVSDYILFIQALIFRHKNIIIDHMLTASSIFIELKSSTLESDLYGLMRCILCLIYVTTYCNVTVPLAKHCGITKGNLYEISYLYAVWLLSMTLSPTLLS